MSTYDAEAEEYEKENAPVNIENASLESVVDVPVIPTVDGKNESNSEPTSLPSDIGTSTGGGTGGDSSIAPEPPLEGIAEGEVPVEPVGDTEDSNAPLEIREENENREIPVELTGEQPKVPDINSHDVSDTTLETTVTNTMETVPVDSEDIPVAIQEKTEERVEEEEEEAEGNSPPCVNISGSHSVVEPTVTDSKLQEEEEEKIHEESSPAENDESVSPSSPLEHIPAAVIAADMATKEGSETGRVHECTTEGGNGDIDDVDDDDVDEKSRANEHIASEVKVPEIVVQQDSLNADNVSVSAESTTDLSSGHGLSREDTTNSPAPAPQSPPPSYESTVEGGNDADNIPSDTPSPQPREQSDSLFPEGMEMEGGAATLILDRLVMVVPPEYADHLRAERPKADNDNVFLQMHLYDIAEALREFGMATTRLEQMSDYLYRMEMERAEMEIQFGAIGEKWQATSKSNTIEMQQQKATIGRLEEDVSRAKREETAAVTMMEMERKEHLYRDRLLLQRLKKRREGLERNVAQLLEVEHGECELHKDTSDVRSGECNEESNCASSGPTATVIEESTSVSQPTGEEGRMYDAACQYGNYADRRGQRVSAVSDINSSISALPGRSGREVVVSASDSCHSPQDSDAFHSEALTGMCLGQDGERRQSNVFSESLDATVVYRLSASLGSNEGLSSPSTGVVNTESVLYEARQLPPPLFHMTHSSVPGNTEKGGNEKTGDQMTKEEGVVSDEMDPTAAVEFHVSVIPCPPTGNACNENDCLGGPENEGKDPVGQSNGEDTIPSEGKELTTSVVEMDSFGCCSESETDTEKQRKANLDGVEEGTTQAAIASSTVEYIVSSSIVGADVQQQSNGGISTISVTNVNIVEVGMQDSEVAAGEDADGNYDRSAGWEESLPGGVPRPLYTPQRETNQTSQQLMDTSPHSNRIVNVDSSSAVQNHHHSEPSVQESSLHPANPTRQETHSNSSSNDTLFRRLVIHNRDIAYMARRRYV